MSTIPPSPLDAMFAQMVGKRIAGGCADCDAYQELEQQMPGIWIIHISHDTGCPTLARHERRRP